MLAEVTDFRRQPQYSLPTLLSVILLGLLSGQNTIRRIAAWAQQMPLHLRRRLGLPHLRVPSRSTLQQALANLNVDDLLRAWQAWVEEARALWPQRESPPELALAVDGKVLRGSADGATDTPALVVLGAMVQQLGVALTHQPVAAGTNEIGTLPSLLEQLLLAGRVVTLDAAHTHPATAEAIVQKGGTTFCG